MAHAALYVIDPMCRPQPSLITRWSLLLVAVVTILFAELHPMSIRSLTGNQRRSSKLLPLWVELATCRRGRAVRRHILSCGGQGRSENDTKDKHDVARRFHFLLLFVPSKRTGSEPSLTYGRAIGTWLTERVSVYSTILFDIVANLFKKHCFIVPKKSIAHMVVIDIT